MTFASIVTRSGLAIALLAAPTLATAQRGGGGGHHGGGGFGAAQHGHPINAWTGSHRPKLR